DGVNVKYAAEIKKHVKYSKVATVGALADPALLEEIIATGKADIVELARGLICEPDLPTMARTGHDADLKKCIRCFTCFSGLMTKGHITCALNPEISIEAEEKFAYPTPYKKTVLVAGGGIAGMQAALEAAKLGHKVTLCEKTDRLGGVLLCEEHVPFKKHLHEYLLLQARFVEESPVEVLLNTPVTKELVEKIAPDAIIAATGATSFVPNIPGIDGGNIYTAEEIYKDHTLANDNVVILGGGLSGSELAIYLAGMGKKVSVVEMAPRLNDGGNILQGQSIDIEFRKLGIDRYLGTKVCEITDTAVVCEKDGERIEIPRGTAVCAFGTKPDRETADMLRFMAPEFFQIGDCNTPKNIAEATRAAHFAVLDLGRFA
ncbi:MAG: FAD-dependent oxidoreductase, partial [Oscillospiraceae bacterium]|nr:FAD-dependent oxidoreductase [Oscillospiraceae bacterium]